MVVVCEVCALLTLLQVFGCRVGCLWLGWRCMVGSWTETCAGCAGSVLGWVEGCGLVESRDGDGRAAIAELSSIAVELG